MMAAPLVKPGWIFLTCAISCFCTQRFADTILKVCFNCAHWAVLQHTWHLLATKDFLIQNKWTISWAVSCYYVSQIDTPEVQKNKPNSSSSQYFIRVGQYKAISTSHVFSDRPACNLPTLPQFPNSLPVCTILLHDWHGHFLFNQ